MQVVVARRWLLEVEFAVRPICDSTLRAIQSCRRDTRLQSARRGWGVLNRWERDNLAARALGDSYHSYGYPAESNSFPD